MSSEYLAKQYLNSQVDLNTVKQVKPMDDIANVNYVNASEEQAKKDYENFKMKLRKFKEAKSFDEAKEIAKTTFNAKNEITYFKPGKAKCAIIQRGSTLKIILDSDKEQICYSFAKKNHKMQTK